MYNNPIVNEFHSLNPLQIFTEKAQNTNIHYVLFDIQRAPLL